MKVIYNNTEVSDNTRNYNTLINRPSLNGITLQGDVSLDSLSMYDKPTTKKLVDATSQIRLVTEMPADPEPNMTYYVGPDERQLYDVILVNDAKQQIHMGTTQFGQYKSGPGVNVKFDNTININTDDVSMYIDSEGNLASSLDGEALPAFIGATASTAGTKGLVPKPRYNQHNALLRGDSSWIDVIDYIYPVGAILLTNESVNPNNLYWNTTWELLEAGYALLNTETGGGVKVDNKGVPNITGTLQLRPNMQSTATASTDAFSNAGYLNEHSGGLMHSASLYAPLGSVAYRFKASDYNTIYGKSNTVQAPAFTVYTWRRTK